MSTIFYAWQSDSDERTNRYFIRRALEAAIKELHREDTVEEAPRLDHDTKGVPGMPDVFQTILNKIANADIFVADVTLVAETPAEERVPNPNAMLELGYALGKITDRRIITVMNQAHGAPEALPFDLARRRWPFTYHLPSGVVPSTAALQELVGQLKGAIRTILQSAEPLGGLDPRESYLASRDLFATSAIMSSSGSEVFEAIRGTVEWHCFPAREDAVRWSPREVIDRMKAAAVSYTGQSFPMVQATDDRKPQRIDEGYMVRYVRGSLDEPRMEFWQLHANGFFGIRRQVPERPGERRLESLSTFRLLGWLAESLMVATNLYAQLPADEQIVWEFRADGLRGRYLSTEGESETDWLMDREHRCEALSYGPRVIVRPLKGLRAEMKEITSEVFTDFCTFFDNHLEPTHFVGWLERFFNRDRALRF